MFNTSPFGPGGFAGLLLEEWGAGLVSGGRADFQNISFLARADLVDFFLGEIDDEVVLCGRRRVPKPLGHWATLSFERFSKIHWATIGF